MFNYLDLKTWTSWTFATLVTCGVWHVTCDIKDVTLDKWSVTCDMSHWLDYCEQSDSNPWCTSKVKVTIENSSFYYLGLTAPRPWIQWPHIYDTHIQKPLDSTTVGLKNPWIQQQKFQRHSPSTILDFHNPWIQQYLDSTNLDSAILNSTSIGYNSIEFNNTSAKLGFNNTWIQQHLDSTTLGFDNIWIQQPLKPCNFFLFFFVKMKY